MQRLRTALLLLMSALWGCSVQPMDFAYAPGVHTPKNTCATTPDCKAGALCVGGICSHGSGGFDAALLRITPDSGKPVFKRVDPLGRAGSHVSVDLAPCTIDVVAQLAPHGQACDLDLRFTFMSSSRSQPFSASVETDASGRADGISLNPGEYDVYADARPGAEQPCLPHLSVARGTRGVVCGEPLVINVSGPGADEAEPAATRAFEFLVEGQGYEGWAFDLITIPSDGLGKRAVSNEVRLSPELLEGGRYRVRLDHLPVGNGGGDRDAVYAHIVRARPPDDRATAALTWSRCGIELQANGNDVLQMPAASARQKVRLSLSNTAGAPEVGSVSIARTFDPTSADAMFAYRENLTVAWAGAEIELLPGNYKVFAVPDAPDLAQVVRDIVVTEDLHAVDIQLGERPRMHGRVALGDSFQSEDGAPVSGVSVFVDPVPTTHSVTRTDGGEHCGANRTLGDRFLWAIRPRSSEGRVGGQGEFQLYRDLGPALLSVQPPVSSGLAWYVDTRVLVGDSSKLQPYEMDLPVVYTGQLKQSLEARVEAFVYVNVEGTDPVNPSISLARDIGADTPVIKVADTYADDEGRFLLLLPPQLY